MGSRGPRLGTLYNTILQSQLVSFMKQGLSALPPGDELEEITSRF